MNDQSILRFSDRTDSIFPAYKKALDEMDGVKKNASNPHFKSKYADLTAVFDAADGPLSKHGLFHIEGQGGRVIDGSFFAVVISRIIHAESGQWVESEMMLPLSKNDPQGAGSAFTYGRRYSMQGLCGLAPEDDDGNAASKARASGHSQIRSAQQSEIVKSKLASLLRDPRLTAQERATAIQTVTGDPGVSSITRDYADGVINALEVAITVKSDVETPLEGSTL